MAAAPATETPMTELAPSPAVVNAILKWPAAQRMSLAQLLTESVERNFPSLEVAEQSDRDLIRNRIEAYERGEIQAVDWRESLARAEVILRAEFPRCRCELSMMSSTTGEGIPSPRSGTKGLGLSTCRRVQGHR